MHMAYPFSNSNKIKKRPVENRCGGGGGKEPLFQPPPLWQGLFGQAAKKCPFSDT